MMSIRPFSIFLCISLGSILVVCYALSLSPLTLQLFCSLSNKCNFWLYIQYAFYRAHYANHIKHTPNHTHSYRIYYSHRTKDKWYTHTITWITCVCRSIHVCYVSVMKYIYIKSIMLKNPHHQHTINLSRDYYLFIIANCKFSIMIL